MSNKHSSAMNEANNEKKTIVPRLRFPEFRDTGEWIRAPLGQLFSERQEVGFTNLPLLSLTDKDGVVPQEGTNRKNNSSADKSKYLRVVPGDIAYNTMRMWEGRSAYVSIEGVISPAYTVCVPSEGVVGIFFAYYFKTEALIREFRKYSQGLVKDTLNLKYEAFSRIEIVYPKKEREQQKIADCLSSLDELITTENQKLSALKDHRKGLMQRLFPREGEAIPRLRFPKFRDAGDWAEEKLESLADRGSGHTPSKSNPEYYGGGIKWVSLADSKRLDCGVISNTEIEISEQGIKNSSAVLHPAGTVILSRDAGVGKSAIMGAPMAVSQHFIAWACNSGRLLNWFLYYELQRSKPLFERVATGSTIKTIGLPFFVEMKIKLPLPPEQKKIADCLFSLDELIAAQSRKIEALKVHKKGLLQQLFSEMDGVHK
ncbi:type I restriction modification DNA specificity domain protein [Burkholderia pseudomallei MSHR1079]|nr:type I restriction modification DNA specificity domain protein [Burkholderia pseudomallei MSHR1079]